MAEDSRTKWLEALPHDGRATLGDLAGQHLGIVRIFEAAMLKTAREQWSVHTILDGLALALTIAA
jgi:hypothetical protein